MNFEEYERGGRERYATFAAEVARIVAAAIEAEGAYRLQQVKHRAKDPASLFKKLEDRQKTEVQALETEIKDLAGCRVIFYTNGDVTRFVNSGVIHENFEVLDVKIHHPLHGGEATTEFYISDHYLVKLNEARMALPEYLGFANMRCEIQIQTILNHAWAEMEHDIGYKTPELGNFGGQEFDGIKERMQKVARKYLVPAGYEFQKIATDFQRLVEGKGLFDGNALEAIVTAPNNNDRAEALELFAERVLPFYDDLQAIYPEVVSRLLIAVDAARITPSAPIETHYGDLLATTYGDIVKGIADLLLRYRYLNVESTFKALCALYGSTTEENDRRPLVELGKALAKHNMKVWQARGPVVQEILVDCIEALEDDERDALGSLMNSMLSEILGTEISGTSSSSSAITISRGSVVASDALRIVREKSIGLLKHQFLIAANDKDRRRGLGSLYAATRPPIGGNYTNELAQLILDNTEAILKFSAEIASTLSLQLLQATEAKVHKCYWMYRELPVAMQEIPELVAARDRVIVCALKFRDMVNANQDYVIYKTLVGFDPVFSAAWQDRKFQYTEIREHRAEEIEKLIASIDGTNAEVWLDRVGRYAQTDSDDLATFPTFGSFLERLSEVHPAIALKCISEVEGSLTNFLHGMLAGLMRSAERVQAIAQINTWLSEGKHVRHIAWYLRFANPFDQPLLLQTLESAIANNDLHATRNVLLASVQQFSDNPGTLVEEIFLPSLRFLVKAENFDWVSAQWFSWLDSPILLALNEGQAKIVLDSLVAYPNLEGSAEEIVAALAKRWPARVVAFLGDRQGLEWVGGGPHRFDALPFEVYELGAALAAAPDILLAGARNWFDAEPSRFTYDGGKLLASIFPNLSNGLDERLEALIASGVQESLAFSLGILSAFEGRPRIYQLVRKIIATQHINSELVNNARSVLHESGVVRGEFGFADLYSARKEMLNSWLDDASESVRTFAADEIRELDRWIARERRSAEASIAMRRLEYGEELDSGGQ
jgi:ppGpp synthetase/RelA/SpoT-type nucleotidyltranferase